MAMAARSRRLPCPTRALLLPMVKLSDTKANARPADPPPIMTMSFWSVANLYPILRNIYISLLISTLVATYWHYCISYCKNNRWEFAKFKSDHILFSRITSNRWRAQAIIAGGTRTQSLRLISLNKCKQLRWTFRRQARIHKSSSSYRETRNRFDQ